MSPSPVPRVRPSPTAPLTSALTPPLSPPTLQRENLSRPKEPRSEETEDKGQRSIRQRPIVSRPPLPRLPPTAPWRGSALHLRTSPRRDSVTNHRWPQTMRNQTGKYFFYIHVVSLHLKLSFPSVGTVCTSCLCCWYKAAYSKPVPLCHQHVSAVRKTFSAFL